MWEPGWVWLRICNKSNGTVLSPEGLRSGKCVPILHTLSIHSYKVQRPLRLKVMGVGDEFHYWCTLLLKSLLTSWILLLIIAPMLPVQNSRLNTCVYFLLSSNPVRWYKTLAHVVYLALGMGHLFFFFFFVDSTNMAQGTWILNKSNNLRILTVILAKTNNNNKTNRNLL